MPVIYNQNLRSARMDEVIDAIDANGPGVIRIGTGNASATPPTLGTVLVEIDLQDPSFTESNGVISMAAPSTGLSGVASAAGTASSAQIEDGSGTVVVSGLRVGTAAPAEITLNSTAISASQAVTLTSGQITHANNA